MRMKGRWDRINMSTGTDKKGEVDKYIKGMV